MGMMGGFAGRLLATGGAFGLGLAGMDLPASTMQVAMCGGGSVRLPIGPDRDEPSSKCPSACHLGSERKRLDDDRDDKPRPRD
ncbi:hypothetical protein BFL28_16260 [Sphingomonas turrisvirgatae]|uniref:Uncharacterized protein n=1 Tax=Sphingomonas turrisvirgatae TaxID=1888892 RepID=A0A1E3LVX7_9SPHN|nr:hypothetical protein BFL28_16260 [Sphingomonas turrisvirgatae]